MRNSFRRIAALVLALSGLFAIPAAAQLVPVAPTPVEKAYPALWKIADEDTTIYLFGTIHALPQGVDWFGGSIEKAFDSSDELVTEIPDVKPGEMQSLIAAQAMLPKGQTLRDMLEPSERTKYETQLGTLGLPPEAFDRAKPWYAAMMLSLMPLMQQGYSAENGAEFLLEARAKAHERGRGALETAAYQIKLFDSLPADAQARYLSEILDNMPKATEQLTAMVAAWRRGDADHLAALMNAEEDDPMLIDMLLIRRNKAWAQWVRDRLAKPGTVFMAVGAGHLAGAGSVQEQLAAAGIASQRVQ